MSITLPTQGKGIGMKRQQYRMHKALAVAVAAALGGCATAEKGSMEADYTYCSRYSDSPECGGKQAATVPAPAPAPAQAAARGQPKEKTVVIAEPGPPPNKAGECYTKVMLPAEWRDQPEQELVRAAHERSEYSEPVYQEVEERFLVKPASKRVTVVPAEFGTVEEKVLVREAYRREIEIPALYNTYYDQVMDKPARDIWKPGRGAIEKVDPTTGEILCLVHEEASYRTVERKELARAASKRFEDVPAEYAMVKKTVMTKAESVTEVEIPAEYETRKVRKLVKMAEPIKVPVAAEYATVNKKVMVAPERAEWTQVLCDVNATPARITQVERALKARGFAVTPDGQIDQQLTDSVRAFQQQNGLHPTGLMTADTLAKLGVTLK
jgi:hypothetical protein